MTSPLNWPLIFDRFTRSGLPPAEFYRRCSECWLLESPLPSFATFKMHLRRELTRRLSSLPSTRFRVPSQVIAAPRNIGGKFCVRTIGVGIRIAIAQEAI